MIADMLKNTKEQQTVVGPLVRCLKELGWKTEQMVFGKKEWRVPKSPSEATKREKGHAFNGFPVDIAVFDSIENTKTDENDYFNYKNYKKEYENFD